MKKVKMLWRYLALIAISICGLATETEAILLDRGNGLFYDTDLSITWLQDANYAKTSGDDADGLMTWSQAVTWAESLVFAGFDDWRLPKFRDIGSPGCNWEFSGTDCGYNVNPITNEMAHLFYNELGNKAYYDIYGQYQPGWGLTNTGDFMNIQPYIYWTGTEVSSSTGAAWTFDFNIGYQTYDGKAASYYAWAVRGGDVSAVPEPSTLILFGSTLLGLVLLRKKFK